MRVADPTGPRDQQLQELTAGWQGRSGSPYARTFTRLLSSLELRTDTVGATLSASSASGVLRGRWSADGELQVGIDTVGQLTLAGTTCTKLLVRLPDGFAAAHVAALAGNTETRQAIGVGWIITGGAGEAGLFTLEGPYLCAYRGGGGSFSVGSIGLYAQLWAEAIPAGER